MAVHEYNRITVVLQDLDESFVFVAEQILELNLGLERFNSEFCVEAGFGWKHVLNFEEGDDREGFLQLAVDVLFQSLGRPCELFCLLRPAYGCLLLSCVCCHTLCFAFQRLLERLVP